MRKLLLRCCSLMLLGSIATNGQLYAQYQYPFQDPKLDVEKRIDNIISLLTPDEKIICLGTNPTIPRLGIKGSGHIEGLHGVALGLSLIHISEPTRQAEISYAV